MCTRIFKLHTILTSTMQCIIYHDLHSHHKVSIIIENEVIVRSSPCKNFCKYKWWSFESFHFLMMYTRGRPIKSCNHTWYRKFTWSQNSFWLWYDQDLQRSTHPLSAPSNECAKLPLDLISIILTARTFLEKIKANNSYSNKNHL